MTDIESKLPTVGVINNVNTCNAYAGKVHAIAYLLSTRKKCVAYGGGRVNFSLASGAYVSITPALIIPVDDSFGAEKLSGSLIVDTNGLKGPNQWGYDIFTFYMSSLGNLVPSGGKVYAKTLGGKENWQDEYWATGTGYTCKVKGKSYGGWGSGCAASIIENGWKIDY